MHVLIIGSGIAGASTAFRLLEDSAVHITIITRGETIQESNSSLAQGGIVMVGSENNDSVASLEEDILRAGDEKNNPKAVHWLATHATPLVEKILKQGAQVLFDSSLGLEAAHSHSRVAHIADHTGKSIMTALLNTLKKSSRIRWKTNCTAIDLIMHHDECIGAMVLENNSISQIFADAVVLATGGIAHLYSMTSNPEGARGDGIAMAHRAGAKIQDLEYIQFHPTVLSCEEERKPLISERVRGEGAILKTPDTKKPFMEQYNSKWKDLAPRDEVSRAIFSEMQAHKYDHVLLDLHSIMPKEQIIKTFPTIYQSCLRYKIDITTDDIPVVPAAHYTCGGVQVDLHGKTTLPRLYAVGEVSHTGLHGANRLASTSLLEGLVWGYFAAEDILKMPSNTDFPTPQNPIFTDTKQTNSSEKKALFQKIKTILWEKVGIVRTSKGLQDAMQELLELQKKIDAMLHKEFLSDEDIGLSNAILVATLIARSAFENHESAGCHFLEKH